MAVSFGRTEAQKGVRVFYQNLATKFDEFRLYPGLGIYNDNLVSEQNAVTYGHEVNYSA